MLKYRLKAEYQLGRNSNLWELKTLESEWAKHLKDFPTFEDYLNLYDKVEDTEMGHYDDFHEKKAAEEAQRNVFKQEDSPGEELLKDSDFQKEWVEWCQSNSGSIDNLLKLDSVGNLKKHYDDLESVNHPAHYCSHPSGVECIQITEHFNFCIGNAVKYLWRAGVKTENPVEDLKKAIWYIQREIERVGG